MTIQEKLSLIQQEFKAKKSRFNSFGKYNFRSAEDILEALKPINEKYKVYFVIEERISEIAGIPIIHSVATMHDGDLSISATAIVGVDLNQKGMQVPQQFGSASSYGKKYALGNLLLIDDTADADATSNGTTNTSKIKLVKGSDNWNKAVEYIKAGGEVSKIITKYEVSVVDRAELKNYELERNNK